MFKQRPKRTTQKLRSSQGGVSPLTSEERKQFQANIPVDILTDVQNTTTVEDVDNLVETVAEGIQKEKEGVSCEANQARLAFGEALLTETNTLKHQTAESDKQLQNTLNHLQSAEKAFFQRAVNTIKSDAVRTVAVFQATEVEVYHAAAGTCPSNITRYLKTAWSAITFVAGWATNLGVWIFKNPAMAQFLFYMLRILRDQFCQWVSLQLGYIAIENPKSLFEKARQNLGAVQEALTRTILIPLLAKFFEPGNGYFDTVWNMFSGGLSATIDTITTSFFGPIVKGLTVLSGSIISSAVASVGTVAAYATTGILSMKAVLFGAIKIAVQNGMQGMIQYYAFSNIYKDLVQIFWVPNCIKSVEIEINSDVYKQYVAEGYITPEKDKEYQEKLKVLKQKTFTLFDVILF